MDPKSTIEKLADRCVLCGLCLPHCPTYRASHREAESPRGRISLILALARGQLEADATLALHLNNCLTCRACEAMCPSEVRYGRLIVAGRALLREQHRGDERSRAMLLGRDNLTGRTLRGAMRAYRASGLKPIANRLLGDSVLGRLNRLVPDAGMEWPLPEFSPARGTERGRVVLFAGCTGRVLEPGTLGAALRLLNRAGYAVHLPKAAMCCGALDLHAGELAGAEKAMSRSAELLAAYDADAIIGIASGCTGVLNELESWLGPEAKPLTGRVHEITAFLAEQDLGELQATPPEGQIAVHEPCSQRNVLRGAGCTLRFLERLGIPATPLPGNDQCCGAAGEYMLTHPESADALRQPKVESLQEQGIRYLVSANIGCALHIAAGAREVDLVAEVLHPVVLAERLLAEAEREEA
ncbi:(Fe-S)-binding protein [Thiohalomonas denitrificans]|uniref:Glycolate oxidase iron-sulfur subunit n=1 Tax=Thiohalomonas denitrificans TaxID=415747 RepID=A0A1G5QHN9_9GAMM|nr:(Fe-S)-binding protein [Thiohalomonas denitrificans]SCZ61383.1 glycolate oxidase iron-sulfur subunit [Thiohalomonas denitrificans]